MYGSSTRDTYVLVVVKTEDCDVTWPHNQVTVRSTDPRFYFDNSSSSLKVASPLDFDGGVTSYMFSLVATDGGTPPLSSSARVKVMLVNKADEPPVFINVREDGTYFEKVTSFFRSRKTFSTTYAIVLFFLPTFS